jgi:DNA helicase HerA-like ATPase
VETKPLGFVDGSVSASTRRFDVCLREDAVLQLDDLLVCEQERVDGMGFVRHFGIVVEANGRLEGAQLPSDTQRIAGDQTMPGIVTRTATVQVLRTDPEVWIPPKPGANVTLVSGRSRDQALFIDKMREKNRLPAGLDQRNEPVYLDFSFVNGEQGAHLSISGVSGVATKTSYALFLLYLLFETKHGRTVLGNYRESTRAVVFNLKGEDLMHIDAPSMEFVNRQEATEQWRALGVDDLRPFKDVKFFAPVSGASIYGSLTSDVDSRDQTELEIFGWTPYTFIERGLLRFAFSNPTDARTQVTYIEESVRLQLRRWLHPVEGEPGAALMVPPGDDVPRSWEGVSKSKRHPRRPAEGQVVIKDFGDLVEFIVRRIQVDNPNHLERALWIGDTAEGTVGAFTRRLSAVQRRLGHLIRRDVVEFTLARSVNVVDLHKLHDDAQRFIVGAILSAIFEDKQSTLREHLRFIMLDELNKYAPKEGSSPIKDLLVDIAARGRSLGVILIGAQQSASNVEPAIIENAAIKVVGRLDAGAASEYRFLTPEIRERATRFLPGTLVLDQPLIPAPIPIRFPFAPYATNKDDDGKRNGPILDDIAALAEMERELL